MEPLQAFVTSDVLIAFCAVGIVVTLSVLLLRVYVRITKQRKLLGDDFALFAAVALYIALAAAYIADIQFMFPVMEWLGGTRPFDESLSRAYREMIRYNWVVQILYWAVLWMVKISLLLFFRRVILRTHGIYLRMWEAALAFTVVSFMGCIITLFTACDSLADNFLLGHCVSPRNTKAQIASLYYSFAADVITDLLIMALPLRIVANLRITRRKDKYKLAALFSIQSIAVTFSVLRVAFTWARTGFHTPSPPWLALWAVIEGMVAIVVGCIPAISQIFRPVYHSSRDSGVQQYLPASTQTPPDWHKIARPLVRANWYDLDEDSVLTANDPVVSSCQGRRTSFMGTEPAYSSLVSSESELAIDTPILRRPEKAELVAAQFSTSRR